MPQSYRSNGSKSVLRVERFEARDVPSVTPTVSLFSPVPVQTNSTTIPVTATFSEDVTQFDASDLVLTNATVVNFVPLSGSSYTFDLIPIQDGMVTAKVPSNSAFNSSSEGNAAAPRLLRVYSGARPTPQIMLGDGQGVSTAGTTATYKVVFTKDVTGFDASDVVITGTAGGAVSAVSGSGNTYTVTVSGVTGFGAVGIQVRDGAAVDTVGNLSVGSAESPTVSRLTAVPTAELRPATLPNTIATAGSGSAGTQVRVFDPNSGQVVTSVTPFPGYAGRIGMAQMDVNGDGVTDLLVGAGAGGAPHVKLFDGATGGELKSFYAYDPGFLGGVSVALGDVTGDGTVDLVVAAGAGGGPHVRVFDGQSGDLVHSFFAYDPGFTNGLNVAVGDVNGDGRGDIVTGVQQGGAPHVKAFDGISGRELLSFYAYDAGFTGGVSVAVGDLNGDQKADIITGTGAGGAPHVKAFDAASGQTIRSFFAYDAGFTGGVRVATADTNQDGTADIVTGTASGGGPHVRVFDGQSGAVTHSFMAFDLTTNSGVSVG